MASEMGARTREKRRLGGWLPNREDALAQYRLELAARAKARPDLRTSVVQELAALVSNDAVLRMNLERAIDDARGAGYQLGYATIDELMSLIDYLMTYAPPFSESSLIICPLNALLDWPMCMPSGYAFFRDPALNAQLKRVLNHWCGFLSGPYSRTHLSTQAPDGWFCDEALKKIGMMEFICDPNQPYWGFASWNSFFTRQFKPGARPVDAPHNSKVIVSACEASPYNIRSDVQLHDRFWIKEQPYSLQEILTTGERELAKRFVGGSVYQAYLSAYNYHRWHAPVNGTVSKAYWVDGSYYSDLEAEGVNPSGLNASQGYTTAIAARAVIVIDCDDCALGQVACVFVGMAEVSSCNIVALPGQHVDKGDEIGYFQYGGSTYCLIFEPGVIEQFEPQPPFDDNATPIKVNARLATAR
ncbi:MULTISPECIES: phosphatidylserine decarboxylase family protein [Burkholderiaceae]|uniref:phosphatidylserine decarboxylase family protein n=1 Tax=Burkholderiaceae TaxID=119060 RepID=UPI0009633DE7|nr:MULTISPECIES: phosphatidylserine decarboxylase family protein [Burkholderiaceae]MCG1040608.1 phosphatidylserine decarboxylase family protein [Mycetohabitans sp. B7]SIT65384.1 phosphatidylserine decarboxylase [Burkholderia sp. b14]